MTVGDMLARGAAKFPDKTAVIDGKSSFTFQQFNERVNRLANALLERGLKKGDRLGVQTANCHQFIELYFAAAKTGAIFCPYSGLVTEKELAYLIDYSEPRFVFYGSAFEPGLKAVAPDLDSVERYVCLDGSEWDRSQSYGELLESGDSAEPEVEVSPRDVMSIYFTSGTTGKPKGAMRSHNHLVTTAVTGVIENQFGYDERCLIVAPMSHVAFEDNLGRCFFIPNTTVVYGSPFDPAKVLETLARERITVCLLVPTMINAMLHSPLMDSVDLSSLKRIFYVGSPMPVELLKKALSAFGRFGTGFCQQYGATETGPLTTTLPPEDHVLDGPENKVKKLASAGRPVLDYQVRIVDAEGNDVPVGEVGEIAVKSEAMMIGYWRLPDKTAEKIKDGWLHTGDMAYFDEDGYVYIVDRKDDLIISGGKNIYPREVEEALYEHPAVLEATVVGVPDDHWGEAVKAVVALKPGRRVEEAELIAFVGQRVAGYKKPKSVEFWPELPKSASGKLLRRKVREKYWRGWDRKI